MIKRSTFACMVFLSLVASPAPAGDTETVSTELKVAKPVAEAKPPGPPDAASLAEGYFALGGWRIGMGREAALEHFTQVEPVEGSKELRAMTRTNLGRDMPATVTFADDKLQSVELHFYRGTDFEQAVREINSALLYMNDHFGGSNFEGGLKTWKDPQAELLRQVLRHSTDSIAAGIREADEKARKKKRRKNQDNAGGTAFVMTMNFRAEQKAEHNFLLGQYRYVSSIGEYQVSVFDDREFVASRIPEASIQLFSAAEEPAP